MKLCGTQSGPGDIRIISVYIRPWKNRNLIFSAELKFPTGDYDKLTGSGVHDFSLRLMLNNPFILEKYCVVLYGRLAPIFLGDTDGLLTNMQNSFVVAGRAGIGWQATKLIQLKLQVDALSALCDSDLKYMGEPAFKLVAGGSFTFTDDVYLYISGAEDIKTLAAADLAFQLTLVIAF